ncbi:MAG: hypothetical protein Q3Y08_07025 [Butyricicoccus sp.]|nr:hypothetical protein [Butyricicoccus sp.]
MKTETFICEHCGEQVPISELVQVGEDILCELCAETHTTFCEHCGERIYVDDACGDDHMDLCQTCYEDHYIACEDCGRLVQREDICYAEEDEYTPLCAHCAQIRNERTVLHSFDYKPEPIFYGEGLRHFGVELEIDEGGRLPEHAQELAHTANAAYPHIYIKTDGSLDVGLEIVTHPMTLDYHLHEMLWAELLDKAKELDYLSHKAETCGLHVHISRTSFGITESEQEAAIARLIYFVEHFWPEVLRFSRRTQRQAER